MADTAAVGQRACTSVRKPLPGNLADFPEQPERDLPGFLVAASSACSGGLDN